MSKHAIPSPWRLGLLLFFFAACALALIGRLASLQIIQHQEFVQRAQNAHWDRRVVSAPRGAIKDREGNPLAIALSTWDISLDPAQLKAPENQRQAIAAVAQATGIAAGVVQQKLDQAQGQPVRIAEKLEYLRGKSLVERGVWGVVAQERIERAYPEGSLAAPLVGFLGKDGNGLTGIEADFDRELAGVPGTLVFERDSYGSPIPLGYRSSTTPNPGGDVVLTIDRFIQRTVERELDAAIARHKADGGTIIVMEPKTGAILATASRPTFDLRKFDVNDPHAMELFRNRAITDLYEPGSTFKLFTMSAALNEGLVTPETTYVDSGPVVKYGRALNTWDGRHYGTESMTEVLIHSNNVGAVWVSDRLEPERFYAYVDKFGFGQPTNIGLSGEASGQVRKPAGADWSPIDLATNAFGQGLNVTPLQLVTAASAIVNGGTLMRPYVVQRIESPGGVRSFEPVPVRRVVSAEVAGQVRSMMKAVSEQATTKAQVAGYHVGVKTGTATIPTAGGYEVDATIASIVGFVPYEDPKAVILVKIDRPKDIPWGSQVAGPVFSALAREMLIYWRVPPTERELVSKVN